MMDDDDDNNDRTSNSDKPSATVDNDEIVVVPDSSMMAPASDAPALDSSTGASVRATQEDAAEEWEDHAPQSPHFLTEEMESQGGVPSEKDDKKQSEGNGQGDDIVGKGEKKGELALVGEDDELAHPKSTKDAENKAKDFAVQMRGDKIDDARKDSLVRMGESDDEIDEEEDHHTTTVQRSSSRQGRPVWGGTVGEGDLRLVEATVVEDEGEVAIMNRDFREEQHDSADGAIPVYEAEQMDNNRVPRWRVRLMNVGVLALVLIVLALTIYLSITLTREKDSGTEELGIVELLLSLGPVVNGTTFDDPSSAQSQALNWLMNDINNRTHSNDEEYSDMQKLQRYVLAVFYFSTNGPHWANQSGWLTGGNECDWFFSYRSTFSPCSARKEIVNIFLEESFPDMEGSTIPRELALLSDNLQKLFIRYNNIGGTIPPEIGLLTNLIIFNVGQNRLSGTIPSQLSNLAQVTLLAADGNENLTGSIPPGIWTLPSLYHFDFRHCSLVGSIPSTVGGTTSLTVLDLVSNRISGTLPSELGLLTNLKSLTVGQNRLGGSLPPQLANSSSLEFLGLADNSFEGSISKTQLPRSLRTLHMEYNNFTGPVDFLGKSALGNLRYVYLHFNQFTGTLPSDLVVGENKTAGFIDLILARNELSGTIPSKLGLVTTLQRVSIGMNNFMGSIPSEICRLWSIPIRQDRPGGLRLLEADCDEVVCSCCNICCNSTPICFDVTQPMPPPPPMNVGNGSSNG